jgi:cell division protein FtsB
MSRLELTGVAAAIVLLGLAFQGGEYGTLDWLQLRRQLADERAAVRALEVELDSLGRAARALETDPVAQERAAREEFGMIRPGELLYRLVPQVNSGSSAGASPVRP